MKARPRPRLGAVYAIADTGALGARPLEEAVAEMAEAGILTIQLRAKDSTSDRELYRAVEACCRRLEGSTARLWMDDRADLATLFDLPGLHVGQHDLPVQAARRVMGTKAWIGLSTHSDSQVRVAAADREVDVVAIGPVFATQGKRNPDPVVGLAGLERARRLTDKPLVAIGGIDADNVAAVLAAGADSAAVLGAICRGAQEPGQIAENCRLLLAAAAQATAG